jgi:hypothetical protein
VKIRTDVADMLRAGVPQIRIARQLHIDRKTVIRTRIALGLPAPKAGRPPEGASLEELYRRRTKPVDGGHLEWTGYRNSEGVPIVRYGKRSHSGYRIAFRIQAGREPVGHVTVGCDYEGCVEPGHVEDRVTRANRRAVQQLLGEVA